MKYLILIYTNPESRQLWDQLPEAEQMAGLEAYAELNDELAESGEMIVSESLADSSLSQHVTMHGGQAVVTDGPFAETKEQLAGFYLVECTNQERAAAIAARIPEAEAGAVEIRPVRTFDGYP